MCNRGYAWLPPPPPLTRPIQKYNMYYYIVCPFLTAAGVENLPYPFHFVPVPHSAGAGDCDGSAAEWEEAEEAKPAGGGGSLHGTNTLAPVRKCASTCTRCKAAAYATSKKAY